MDEGSIKYFSTNAGIFGTPDLEARISSGEITLSIVFWGSVVLFIK